jgi:hypothetical protein
LSFVQKRFVMVIFQETLLILCSHTD